MIKDYSYAVVGLGKAGLAACTVLSDLGAQVSVFTLKPKNADPNVDTVSKLPNVDLMLVDSNEELVDRLREDRSNYVIVSPGVPATGVVWEYLYSSGREVFSDVELAWRYGLELSREGEPSPVWLCVTGTNGKTTTTGMLNSILGAAGICSVAVGNIGLPVITAIHEKKYEVLAVELSSFNLHSSVSVSPVASACLNVSDDHIDWHGGFENYAYDKGRIYHNCRVACIYNCEDDTTLKLVENADVVEGCRAIGVTMSAPSVSQIGVVEDLIVDRAFIPNRHSHGQVLASFDDLKHLCVGSDKVPEILIQDAMFAAALARSVDVDSAYISEGLRQFRLDNHRFAFVDVIDGVSYINDSKATNPHAMLSALNMLPDGKVVLLCGGDAKGADLIDVFAKAERKIKALVILGADHFDVLRGVAESKINVDAVIVEHEDDIAEYMRQAVLLAKDFASEGDFVLLSPACASWDQFDSYKHRGDLFTESVLALKTD